MNKTFLKTQKKFYEYNTHLTVIYAIVIYSISLGFNHSNYNNITVYLWFSICGYFYSYYSE